MMSSEVAGSNKERVYYVSTMLCDYLYGVVNEKGGTGILSESEVISIAGKTGTAQVVRLVDNGKELKEKDIPFNLRDHAWFVAFAPFDFPKISVAVIVEHGGHGGVEAAPIVKEIIEKSLYFLDKT